MRLETKISKLPKRSFTSNRYQYVYVYVPEENIFVDLVGGFGTTSYRYYGIKKMDQVGINTKPYIAEIIGSVIIAIILFIIPAKIGTLIIRILGLLIILVGIILLLAKTKREPLIVYAEEVPNDPNETKKY